MMSFKCNTFVADNCCVSVPQVYIMRTSWKSLFSQSSLVLSISLFRLNSTQMILLESNNSLTTSIT
jgi:hypothetical protein